MSNLPELLTPAQVAQALGKSVRWVQDMAKAKQIGHVKVGRSLRFTAADLAEYIAAQHRARAVDKQQRADESWGRATRRTRRI